jgi:Protein of unknown function (DUF2939)
MRRVLKWFVILVSLAAVYALWPVHAALQIREAVIAGDSATLNRKVEWDTVRKSLKDSITPETIARLVSDPDAPKPTLWQRVKAAVAPSMADSVIDRYVTPEHLPVLLGYRRVYRGTLRPALGLKEPPTVLAGTWLGSTPIDELASFWSRVRRAVFVSPTRFVLEVEDKYRPGRNFVGTLELRGYEWKLVGLNVTGTGL